VNWRGKVFIRLKAGPESAAAHGESAIGRLRTLQICLVRSEWRKARNGGRGEHPAAEGAAPAAAGGLIADEDRRLMRPPKPAPASPSSWDNWFTVAII